MACQFTIHLHEVGVFATLVGARPEVTQSVLVLADVLLRAHLARLSTVDQHVAGILSALFLQAPSFAEPVKVRARTICNR